MINFQLLCFFVSFFLNVVLFAIIPTGISNRPYHVLVVHNYCKTIQRTVSLSLHIYSISEAHTTTYYCCDICYIMCHKLLNWFSRHFDIDRLISYIDSELRFCFFILAPNIVPFLTAIEFLDGILFLKFFYVFEPTYNCEDFLCIPIHINNCTHTCRISFISNILPSTFVFFFLFSNCFVMMWFYIPVFVSELVLKVFVCQNFQIFYNILPYTADTYQPTHSTSYRNVCSFACLWILNCIRRVMIGRFH